MEKNWWKSRFVNRRDWILDSLQDLSLNADETMAVLLIDFLNEHDVVISHGILAEKLKKHGDEIDELLTGLTKKGYLEIGFQDRKIVFDIEGIFTSVQSKAVDFDASLFDVFESEFARPLSQVELQRMSHWLQEYDQKLILYALREAVIYDVKKFDYIERILQDWKKKGYTAKEIEDGKR